MITTSLFSVFGLGVQPYKNLRMKIGSASETQTDFNNLMRMSVCVDFAEHS